LRRGLKTDFDNVEWLAYEILVGEEAKNKLRALNFSLRRKKASIMNIFKIFETPIFGTRDIKLYVLVIEK
jgi:hypothetical protein